MRSDGNRADRFLDPAAALACIHCGLCLGSCPTYLETGNENESPRGRIYLMRAVDEGRLVWGESAVGHIDRCLGCMACEAACPSGVGYGGLLEGAREHLERHYRRRLWDWLVRRLAIERVFPYPDRMRWILVPARMVRALRLERFLPRAFREGVGLLPENGPASDLPEMSRPASGIVRGRVGLMGGCVQRVLFGETNMATLRLIHANGYEAVVPGGQVCCGALYAHAGNLERARECARRNIAAFEGFELEAIIINAAGCGSTLKGYGHLLAEEGVWSERARVFSAKVKDLSEWLVDSGFLSARLGSDKELGEGKGRVTFHDACHLAHAQRITAAPRRLLRAVAGSRFIELPEADLCCGSAGSYNLTEPEMAERLQRRKVEAILKTGAETVVTTNPGCLLQIRAGLRKAGKAARVIHLADFLEAEMRVRDSRAKRL